MKQSCFLILIFHLALTVQYAASETFRNWYKNTVMNCTAGSTIKSYKPHMICICLQPGVIEYCQLTEMRGNSDSTGGKGEHKKALLQGKDNNLLTQGMKLSALKKKAQSCKVGEKFKQPYASCNWCTCVEDGVVTCDTELCP